jgi:hypothetical protein
MTIKRLQIVDEVARRLSRGLREPLTRGFANIPVKTFPSIYLFEDEEAAVKVKPGIYRKTLPLVIERFVRLPSGAEAYIYGNRCLHELVEAIELDERLCKGFSPGDTVDTTNELVIDYSMTSNVMVEMSHNVLDIVVTYNFEYVCPFLGYQVARH